MVLAVVFAVGFFAAVALAGALAVVFVAVFALDAVAGFDRLAAEVVDAAFVADAVLFFVAVDRRRFGFLSPIGSALLTAFTASLAAPPTVPAILPAV